MTTETILELTTSLDDTTPQVIGYVLERALELGALDACATPAVMKKQRPGWVLTLLSRPRQRRALLALLFDETPTLGVRVRPVRRVVVSRRIEAVETRFGPIRVKRTGGQATPEYEDCRAAARHHGVPLHRVQQAALQAAAAPGPPAKRRRSSPKITC